MISKNDKIIMKGLKQIKSPIEKDILIFQKEFDNAVDLKIHIINVVMNYMMKKRGKILRANFD